MDDQYESITKRIKEGRASGLNDREVEQQLFLETWTPSALKFARNFLQLTQAKSSREKEEVDMQRFVRYEHTLNRRILAKAVMRFLIIPAVGIIAIVLLVDFFASTSKTAPDITAGSMVPNTVTSDMPIPQASVPTPVQLTPGDPSFEPQNARRAIIMVPGGRAICTPDKKVCPSGTMLSRRPPACDFADCSSTTSVR